MNELDVHGDLWVARLQREHAAQETPEAIAALLVERERAYPGSARWVAQQPGYLPPEVPATVADYAGSRDLLDRELEVSRDTTPWSDESAPSVDHMPAIEDNY